MKNQVTYAELDAMAVRCGLQPLDEYRRPLDVRQHLLAEYQGDQRRHSGRTTHSLLKVLVLVARGRDVAFVADSRARPMYRDRLFSLARAARIDVRTVRFVSLLQIRELAMLERASGLVVVLDHHHPDWDAWWRRYPKPPWKMSATELTHCAGRRRAHVDESPARRTPRLGIQAMQGHSVFCICPTCDPEGQRRTEWRFSRRWMARLKNEAVA